MEPARLRLDHAGAIAARPPAGNERAERVNRWLIAGHLVLAAFVMLRGYPATQDGPAHAYGAHVLRALARDPASPYAEAFASNLHPGSNSLFFYLALWTDGIVSVERIAGIALFLAVAGLPLSAVAFAAALRAQAPAGAAAPERAGASLPLVSAASLACPLAYNYFVYRGFFNYALSVPLAMGCLSAVVAAGATRRVLAAAGLAAIAMALAALTSLAHPSAIVFLLAAIPMASLRGNAARRCVGGLTFATLAAFAWVSRVAADESPSPEWSSPATAVMQFVRALGVTHSWLELLPACFLLLLLAAAARRALRPIRGVFARWERAWPAALAVALSAGFFVVPFAYGGAAGLNERIPLFVAMLLLPYVPMQGRLLRWMPVGFALFALYTGAGSVIRDRRIDGIRDAAAAAALPRGALLYPVSLDIKLGSLGADLGRHLLADVARRRDAIAGDTFCGHPAHPLRCTSPIILHDDGPLERFAHLNAEEQEHALADPTSPIRATFRSVVELARGADYMAVIPSQELDAAFRERVLRELGAEAVGPESGPLRLYRLPPLRDRH